MPQLRNLIAAFTSFFGAAAWTKGLSYLVKSKRLRPHAARKVMHITTAPLFALTWPLYGPQPHAAYFAALVPLSFALRILSNPRGDPLVQAVAYERTPPRVASQLQEAHVDQTNSDSSDSSDFAVHLRHAYGPISYGLSVAAITAVSWRDNPETYIAFSALCLGDGMADVIGSACKGPRWPLPTKVFTKRKTVPGTVAFFFSALLGSVGFLKAATFSVFARDTSWQSLIIAAGSSAVVELFPIEDNITVPLVASLAARTVLKTRQA